MNEVIILDSKNKKILIEYLYSIENYHTMTIKVESEGFSGKSNFCISRDSMINILSSLELAIKELSGSVQIRDRDSDAHIDIIMKSLGQLSVTGQIGGSFEDHFLKFKFDSDQTILVELRNFFKSEL